MNQVAKIALGAAAVTATILTSISYYSGLRLQQGFKAHLEQNWHKDNSTTSLELMEYERGIFTSTAKTQWSFTISEEPLVITLQHSITHAPWPRGKAGHIFSAVQMPSDAPTEVAAALKKQSPLTCSTTIAWNKESHHIFDSPEITIKFKDGSRVEWGGMHAALFLSAQRATAKGWLKAPNLDLVSQAGSRLHIAGADAKFSAQQVLGHSFWSGPAELKLATVKVFEAKDQLLLTLHNYTLESTSEIEEKIMNTIFNASIEKIETPENISYNLNLDLHFKNFNHEWIDEIINWSHGNIRNEKNRTDIFNSLPIFLKSNPEIAIENLSIQTPEGLSKLNAKIAFTGDNPLTINPLQDIYMYLHASAPREMVEFLLAEKVRSDYLDLLEKMDHEISEEAFESEVKHGVIKRLNTLIDNGSIIKNNQNLSTKIEFSSGKFKINEEEKEIHQIIGIGGSI